MTFGELVGITLGVLSILTIILTGLGWWIRTQIKLATYQISPDANGGKSLPDLHAKVDRLCVDMELVKSVVMELEDDVDQLEAEVEELINE
jgi:hypothetical protein